MSQVPVLLVFAMLGGPLLPGADGLWGVGGQGQVTGSVVDQSGAPVPGATVQMVVDGAPVASATTGADGRFVLAAAPGPDATLEVRAEGLAPAAVTVPPVGDAPLHVVLAPAGLSESVTVTASRGSPGLATPAPASVLASAEIVSVAAGALDDVLRATPGFSLFRRSSSRTANPTTQGVTLRGLAGSGASRTLVLADGFPLNDPFGSWVYWNRVPQAAVDRVEIVRGAGGDLYGPDALGGVIQVLTFDPERTRVRVIAEGGSHGTGRGSAFGGSRRGGFSGAVAGEWLETDGVPIVAEADRGPVDVPAGSDYRNAFGRMQYDREGLRISTRGSFYAEHRGNGTRLQVNDTSWRQLSGEAMGAAAGGTWSARADGGTQDYHQTFSAVAPDRASERLTTEQRIPTSFVNAGGQWARTWSRSTVLFGADVRRVDAEVRESRYPFTGEPSTGDPFGGTETSVAGFGRLALVANDRMVVTLGARAERWTSDPLREDEPRHANGFFSPRVSVGWQLAPSVSAQAAAYRAYRTPTLNELHRGFRVGNVLTNPNPLLDPERLTGVEGGLLFAGRDASARVSVFWNHLDRAVTNVTMTVTPALIIRERQNAGRVGATGVELEVDVRPHAALRLTGLAAFTRSRFLATTDFPDLEGNRVPQVPVYQLGAGVTYAAGRSTLTSQVRAVGLQYDDDRNQLELRPFVVVDAYASHALGAALHAFAAVENLFDVAYDVGRTPVLTVGWPRTVRAGLRLFLP